MLYYLPFTSINPSSFNIATCKFNCPAPPLQKPECQFPHYGPLEVKWTGSREYFNISAKSGSFPQSGVVKQQHHHTQAKPFPSAKAVVQDSELNAVFTESQKREGPSALTARGALNHPEENRPGRAAGRWSLSQSHCARSRRCSAQCRRSALQSPSLKWKAGGPVCSNAGGGRAWLLAPSYLPSFFFWGKVKLHHKA